jgi:hypothetical protein
MESAVADHKGQLPLTDSIAKAAERAGSHGPGHGPMFGSLDSSFHIVLDVISRLNKSLSVIFERVKIMEDRLDKLEKKGFHPIKVEQED